MNTESVMGNVNFGALLKENGENVLIIMLTRGCYLKPRKQVIIGFGIIAISVIYMVWSYLGTVNNSEPASTYLQKGEGQIRNNLIDIDKESCRLFRDDPAFNNFKDTGKLPEEYETWFLNSAKDKGIDETKLKKCLEKAKGLQFWTDEITRYPVIVETAKYKNRDSFVLVFTWEISEVIQQSKNVGPLGHILIVEIQTDNQRVIAEEHCK